MNYKVKLVKMLYNEEPRWHTTFTTFERIEFSLEKDILLYHRPITDTILVLREGRTFHINTVIQFEETDSFQVISTQEIEYWKSDQLEKIKEDYIKDGWKEMNK